MARLHFALSILGVAGALMQVTLGQVMMCHTAPMILRHPHHMGHLIQPIQMTQRTEYASPKEPIDEERLQQRIKELEASQHALREKQIDLDEKIAILDEEALRCQKQIAEDQQEIHKLEELERLHYMEQVRLERLIEQQRIAEYQEKLHQERLAQQREIEEMNRNEERQRNANKKDPYDVSDETSTNGTYEARRVEEDTSETYKHQLDEKPSNEPGKDAIQARAVSGRAQKNEQLHSTARLLKSKPSVEQKTLDDLQPKIAPTMKHVIEKKEVHGEPSKEVINKNDNLKVVMNP